MKKRRVLSVAFVVTVIFALSSFLTGCYPYRSNTIPAVAKSQVNATEAVKSSSSVGTVGSQKAGIARTDYMTIDGQTVEINRWMGREGMNNTVRAKGWHTKLQFSVYNDGTLVWKPKKDHPAYKHMQWIIKQKKAGHPLDGENSLAQDFERVPTQRVTASAPETSTAAARWGLPPSASKSTTSDENLETRVKVLEKKLAAEKKATLEIKVNELLKQLGVTNVEEFQELWNSYVTTCGSQCGEKLIVDDIAVLDDGNPGKTYEAMQVALCKIKEIGVPSWKEYVDKIKSTT